VAADQPEAEVVADDRGGRGDAITIAIE
jgi:hypothetical protein